LDLTFELLVCVAGSTLLAYRLAGARPEPDAPKPTSADTVDVSVIVPARDEIHNLGDHSRDGSGALALSLGARVVVPEPLPRGAVGKPWACAAGARVATGSTLLFTDADTEHTPGSLGAALGLLQARGAGLLSAVPTHRVVDFWERLQGTFQLLLLIATRAGTRTPAAHSARRYAIGQYLLLRRDVYDAVGGHLAVVDRLSEDLALARAVAAHGHPVQVMFAPDLYRVRMYPEGFAAFVAGWRRSFRDGLPSAGPSAVLELTTVIAYLLGVPLWGLSAFAAGQYWVAAFFAFAYLTTAWVLSRAQRHLGPFSGMSALAYPLPVLAFVGVSLLSLLDTLLGRPVMWRGRRIAQRPPA